jgi:hypothetical protein
MGLTSWVLCVCLCVRALVCVLVELKRNNLQFLAGPNDVPKTECNTEDKTHVFVTLIMKTLSFTRHRAQTRSLTHHTVVSFYWARSRNCEK